MKKAIFVLLATVILWFIFLRNDTVRFGPGVLAPDPPKQANNDTFLLPRGFKAQNFNLPQIDLERSYQPENFTRAPAVMSKRLLAHPADDHSLSRLPARIH